MGPTESDVREAAPPRAGGDVFYGVAGWSYADWEGVVYPARADSAAKLLTVAGLCDVLEINTSFYATPPAAVTATWVRRLTRAALPTRLVVKVNRVFTHEEQFTDADAQALRLALAPMDESAVIDRNGVEQPRLLGLLIQFPHFFRLTPENTQRIERLGEEFADWTRIVELRHASWNRAVTLDWLRKRGFCLANIDLPGGRETRMTPGKDDAGTRGPGDAGTGEVSPASPRRRVSASGAFPDRRVPLSRKEGDKGFAFPPRIAVTGPVGYLRLHGRNAKAWFDRQAPVDEKYNYLYRPNELSDLADRIRELAARARTVVVVGNNHYRGKALATVLSLAHLVEGRRVKLPAAMLEAYPQLTEFAEPLAAEPPASAAAPRVAEPATPAAPGQTPQQGRPPKARKKPARRRPPEDHSQMKLFE